MTHTLEYMRAYRAKNRARLLEQEAARRAANRDKVREYGRNYARQPEIRAKNLAYQKSERGKDVKWATKIKAKYGLTRDQYRFILDAQNRRCKTCNDILASRKSTHVDHSHATGKVRGILCAHCNRALGGVRDRVDILFNLIAYLEASL